MKGNGGAVRAPVDEMLAEIPAFQNAVNGDLDQVRHSYGGLARQDLLDHPGETRVSYPFQSSWGSISQKDVESADFKFGVGSFSYSVTGYAEAVRNADGSISESIHYQVHLADRFNFSDYKTFGTSGDGGNIDVSVSERDVNDLVRAGRAQEFDIRGSTGTRTG
jgi:hypothetical protein